MNGAIETIVGFLPVVAVVLFALPAYIGVLYQRGFLKGLAIIVILSVFALVSGTLALKTGFPYGNFSYGDVLGHKLFGTTPWILAFAYPPILLAAFWLAGKFTETAWRIPLMAIFVTLIDAVLDPAMVTLEFWKWENAGPFYGVPIINFAGWLLNGLVAGLILHKLWGKKSPTVSIALGGIGMLLFWTGAAIGTELWISSVIGVIVSMSLLIVLYAERKQAAYDDTPDEEPETVADDDFDVSVIGD